MFSKRLKEVRKEFHCTQEQLAEGLGVGKSTISMWENGNRTPDLGTIEAIADYFNVNLSRLIDKKINFYNPKPTDDFVTFPVIGELAAGFETIAIEDWTGDTIDIPSDYLKGHKASDFIVLKVKGDSMYPFFLEDDKVLILKQSFAESGQYAAVIYDDEYATLKKIEYGKNVLRLIPRNPEYKTKEIYGADIERCYIIGVPKLLIREI